MRARHVLGDRFRSKLTRQGPGREDRETVGKPRVRRQLLADVFERPVELLQTSETGCLGAALYAGTAVGVYPDVAAAVDQAVTVTETYQPDETAAPQYEKAFRRYQAVFDALTDTVFTSDF